MDGSISFYLFFQVLPVFFKNPPSPKILQLDLPVLFQRLVDRGETDENNSFLLFTVDSNWSCCIFASSNHKLHFELARNRILNSHASLRKTKEIV